MCWWHLDQDQKWLNTWLVIILFSGHESMNTMYIHVVLVVVTCHKICVGGIWIKIKNG